VAWAPSQVFHQGQICSNQHKEGQVLGYWCQLCAYGETGLMALRALDGKQPIMGRAWLVMKT